MRLPIWGGISTFAIGATFAVGGWFPTVVLVIGMLVIMNHHLRALACSRRALILQLFLDHLPDEDEDDGWMYSYQICKLTGLNAGPVYSALRRLKEEGWLKDKCEYVCVGTPAERPRYYYRLSSGKVDEAKEVLAT